MMDQVRGIVLPSPTVFLQDGTVNKADARAYRLVHRVRRACVFYSGFVRTGTRATAGAEEESRRDHRSAGEASRACGGADRPVDPYSAIDLGKHAKSIGAEAIGHVGPYYYADRSEYEIIEHFKMVNRAVGMPILVYNNPRYSGYNIHPDFMARLVSAVPRIFGAKLAMGSVDEAMAYMKIVRAPFATYALASNLVSAMSVSIAGTISPPLAVTPEIGVELVRAIDAGESDKALALQKTVIRIHDIFLRLAGPFGRTITARLSGCAVSM